MNKKIRFEVFKRDGFQCAYCGKTPPEVMLEVDHVEPVSLGGTDDINNLITACFDCNRGKTNIPLDKIPNQLSENLEVIKERETQVLEYKNYVAQIEKRIQKEIREVEKIFQYYFKNNEFTLAFKETTIKNFLKKLSLQTLKDAMHKACNKVYHHPNYALKYFCGICWNKIRGDK